MLSFSCFGCRIRLTFSCFALLAFCCLFTGPAGGVFLWLAAALHEGAHLTALFCFCAPPKTACFSALGCRIATDPAKPLCFWESGVVSLAGPLANLLAFAAAALLGEANHPFAAASLALGVFHCLPIEPLDGGLALRAFLAGLFGADFAERAVFCLSLLLLLPLSVLGFCILLRTRYNFSLLALSLYFMFYLLLKRDFFTG